MLLFGDIKMDLPVDAGTGVPPAISHQGIIHLHRNHISAFPVVQMGRQVIFKSAETIGRLPRYMPFRYTEEFI